MCIRDSLYVIARHTHLNTCRQFANACYVSCPEVELRTVVVEERCMTATLVFGQNVNLSGKLLVALNGTWLTQTLSSFDFSSLDTTQQSADVVTSLSLVKQDVYKRQVTVPYILSVCKAEEGSGVVPPLTDDNAADGGNEFSNTP